MPSALIARAETANCGRRIRPWRGRRGPIAPAEQVVNLAWRRVGPLNCSAFAEATGATSKALHREVSVSQLDFFETADRGVLRRHVAIASNPTFLACSFWARSMLCGTVNCDRGRHG